MCPFGARDGLCPLNPNLNIKKDAPQKIAEHPISKADHAAFLEPFGEQTDGQEHLGGQVARPCTGNFI